MSKIYLGIDIGGTKTEALLAKENGEILALLNFGSGNPDIITYKGLHLLLNDILSETTKKANITKLDITSIGIGIAGFDWPSQKIRLQKCISELNFLGKIRFENDVILGLIAGTSEGWGVCINAGTSFNCRGMSKDGGEGRVIGDGLVWGEGAGSIEVVQKAIQSVGASWTKRGKETILSDAILSYYNENEIGSVIEKLVTKQYPVDQRFAPIVFECARQGDIVANEIINWAGKQLGSLGLGVIRQLKLENSEFEVVLTGSMFNAGDIIINPLISTIKTISQNAKFVRLEVPPVVGGLLLAMQVDGINDKGKIDQVKRKFNKWKNIN